VWIISSLFLGRRGALSAPLLDLPEQAVEDEMVKDPNCETYIPKKESIEKKIIG